MGHTMSWHQLGGLMDGNIPLRRWDSTLISVASILGVTPYHLLGLPTPNSMYDKTDMAWPGPLIYEAKGHTKSWIAKQLGVSPVKVGNWFSGNLPPLAMLWKLADVLGCEVSELVPTKKQGKDVIRSSVG